MPELEIVAGKTAGELRRPSLPNIRARFAPSHRLPVRNRPAREDSKHDHDPDEMRKMPEFSQFPCPMENGHDDRIKENQMDRPFREQPSPRKIDGTIQISHGDRR